MGAYREPSEPTRSDKTIVLPRHRVQRVILGVCLWFMCFWFLIFPVAWVVEALVRGEDLWRLLVAPPAWGLLVWGIVRLMRFDQVMIGSVELRRAGFFRDRRVRWSEVRGFEERMKPRTRGRPVRLYAVQTGGKELVVAPDVVVDPERDLRWCLEQAEEGDLAAIDERVRARGAPFSAWPRRLTHLGIATVLSVSVGVVLWGDQKRRLADRVLAYVPDRTYEEDVAALAPVVEDDGFEPRVRCRAASRLSLAATRRGELERARRWCEATATIGCEPPYLEDCATEPFAILGEVRAALDAGDPERAVALLGALRFRGAFRDSLEVEALRASGSPAMARVVAERCIDAYADSEDPVLRAFAERCRGAL